MESLSQASSDADRLSREASGFVEGLQDLQRRAGSVRHYTDLVASRVDNLERQLVRAQVSVAHAELALAVRNFKHDWIGFVDDVDELLASLEAAPVLAVCPN